MTYQWPAQWLFILRHSTVMVFNTSWRLELMKLAPFVLYSEIGFWVQSTVRTGPPVLPRWLCLELSSWLPLLFILSQINSLWSCFTQSRWKVQQKEVCIIPWICLKLNQQPPGLVVIDLALWTALTLSQSAPRCVYMVNVENKMEWVNSWCRFSCFSKVLALKLQIIRAVE